jgi:trehalose 6-phosphate phosphatase
MAISETASGAARPLPGDVDPKSLTADGLAILLDIDGTLIELAPTPQEVRVPASLKHTLSRLRDRLGGALALVSGRPLSDIDNLFKPLVVAAVGGHGAENRLSITGGVAHRDAGALDPEVRKRLLAVAEATPGVLAEDKGYSMALHYRLAPDYERQVHDAVVRICRECAQSHLEILPGKSMFEVKPKQFNKGTAVRELMRQPPFRGRRPLFIGDDVTDESVFGVMPEFDGLAFSVGRRLSGTHGDFLTPREVRHWLYSLITPARPEPALSV